MLEIGSLVDGKYKILNKVGQGGMSVVYLAMNEKANKQWAVKEVRKDGIKDFEIVKQGLVAETDILKKLKHPNLPSIVDVIDSDDSFIIIMDYIEGNSLNKALEEYGAQPQEYVIDWAKQLTDVLGYLHTRNPAIIYRDMKPSNVMLKPDGNVTLIDFGTAREFKEKNLADTVCLGTIGYAAPEQFGGMGQTDARTDIYCLGATLYHLVTGMNPCEPPYEIKPIRQINPALSEGLERIILKCTQRNPNDRYQSAAELMYALEHYEEYDHIYRQKQKRKLGTVIATTALSIIMAGVSVWGYTQAVKKNSENYDIILNEASEVQDYYDAILTEPGRVDAYLELNDFMTSDYGLSKEEGQQLNRLLVGLDKTNRTGFTDTIAVLDELKTADPDAYNEVCFEYGWSFLSYYENSSDRDRFSAASKWLSKMRDNGTREGEIASIFCDISECVSALENLRGSKVIQTEALREERENLWNMTQNLMTKAQGYSSDYQLQVWEQVNNLINIYTTDFLSVAEPAQLIELLQTVSTGSEELANSNPDLKERAQQLKTDVDTTIARVQTARN